VIAQTRHNLEERKKAERLAATKPDDGRRRRPARTNQFNARVDDETIESAMVLIDKFSVNEREHVSHFLRIEAPLYHRWSAGPQARSLAARDGNDRLDWRETRRSTWMPKSRGRKKKNPHPIARDSLQEPAKNAPKPERETENGLPAFAWREIILIIGIIGTVITLVSNVDAYFKLAGLDAVSHGTLARMDAPSLGTSRSSHLAIC
jgi:hypothetical protein